MIVHVVGETSQLSLLLSRTAVSYTSCNCIFSCQRPSRYHTQIAHCSSGSCHDRFSSRSSPLNPPTICVAGRRFSELLTLHRQPGLAITVNKVLPIRFMFKWLSARPVPHREMWVDCKKTAGFFACLF